MTKAAALVAICFLPISAYGQLRPTPVATVPSTRADMASRTPLTPEGKARAIIAPACVAASLSCSTRVIGTLGPGDCTFDDGTSFDVYRFQGTAGQLVTFDLRPLSATLTSPMIVLAPPAGDASKTPLIYGGNGTEVTYLLATSGTWTVAAGTHDLFGSGDYLLAMSACEQDTMPQLPQNCVTQGLVCNQTASWDLTNQSCRFTTGDTYQEFEIYGVAGDTLSVSMLASDFQPNFGVFSEATNSQIGSPVFTDSSATKVIQTLTFPSTGFYDIVATSNGVGPKAGFFTLTTQCFGSGCLVPLFTNRGQLSLPVPFGNAATVTFPEVTGTEPLSTSWLDESLTVLSTSRTLLTGPLFANTKLFATATNACGSDTSQSIQLTVAPPARKRAARH